MYHTLAQLSWKPLTAFQLWMQFQLAHVALVSVSARQHCVLVVLEKFGFPDHKYKDVEVLK